MVRFDPSTYRSIAQHFTTAPKMQCLEGPKNAREEKSKKKKLTNNSGGISGSSSSSFSSSFSSDFALTAFGVAIGVTGV